MTYQGTPPPPVWSVRWLAWTALFANQFGVWSVLLFAGLGHSWQVDVVAVAVSLLGLVIAASRVARAFIYGRQLWTLCDNVYGPATDGATVMLTSDGVFVEYPE